MTKTLLTTAALSASLVSAAVAGNADALDTSFGVEKDSFLDRFTFGSYGEIHSSFSEDGTDIDPHRIVLFTDFQISDKLKLVTETELEHALRKKAGSTFTSDGVKFKLEQAYLEYGINDHLTAKAGLILVPAGVINETHEPTTFYGVERPNVEKNIIPTTWTELGVGVTKVYDSGLQLDAMLHSGLDIKGGSIRDGRSNYQFEEFKSNSESWAVTTRAKYTGLAGIELAGSLQYQSDLDSAVSGNQDAILATTHGVYRNGGFQFIGLASYWDIDVSGDAGEQWGYYLEPSYAWDTAIGKVGVFGRYSQYEYSAGGAKNREVTEMNAGVNYWINDNLVVKADYLTADRKDTAGTDESYNLGFGWHF